ncbi:MAG: dihydropteroate synthase [Hyphomicrobiaceae bacterium]
MMLREIYIRPLGLYAARAGDAAEEVWGGFRLAQGWLDFAGVEVIERNGARVDRRIAGIGEFLERDWGRRALNAADMFEMIRQPRPHLVGLDLSMPRIMGIINATPDSFSDGGALPDAQAAIDHARHLEDAGADILDIGAESTRPGSDPVPLDEERRRVLPIIEALAGNAEARISVDTRKAELMREAIAAGADIINDVSALSFDPEALETVADLDVPVILMHALGDPKTMQDNPVYDDVLLDVFDYLEARVEACLRAGIARENIVIDPGIGFGKTLAHNLALLSGLSLFHGLGLPVLVGASRKRFIGKLSGVEVARERVSGSIAAALAAVAQGAQIVRVHDAAETRQALTVWQAATQGVPLEI